jgi:hypothetical protein
MMIIMLSCIAESVPSFVDWRFDGDFQVFGRFLAGFWRIFGNFRHRKMTFFASFDFVLLQWLDFRRFPGVTICAGGLAFFVTLPDRA